MRILFFKNELVTLKLSSKCSVNANICTESFLMNYLWKFLRGPVCGHIIFERTCSKSSLQSWVFEFHFSLDSSCMEQIKKIKGMLN